MINLQLEGLGRASHSDATVLQTTHRPKSRKRMACVAAATPMTNEADKIAKAAKQAAFSPLKFLQQPWGRDAMPSEPEVSQDYVALAEEAKQAAAIIADAERRAAKVQQELDEQHQHVSSLLSQLREMNAQSTEAGYGKSMLVPLETVPADVRTMLDQQLRRAAAVNVVAAPEQPAVVAPPRLVPPGERYAYGTGYEVLLQGFNWESHKQDWYKTLRDEAEWYADMGFTSVWTPPPTASVSPEGYMPTDYYNLNSKYGSPEDLKRTVELLHSFGLKVVGDVVLNHRCALHQDANGIWNVFGGKLNWDASAVVSDDPHFRGRGNPSTGDNFHAAPNIDHRQPFVRDGISEWLQWLRSEYGFDGWRLDFARGFSGEFVKEYCERSEPLFVVGEYWDSLKYSHDGRPDYNQNDHRQRIVNWLNSAGGLATAFDVTTKGILHEVFARGEYWRLRDAKGKPPGVMGWWPSRTTTFLENHDTGSTQGHWRFPHHGLEEGYAYILTHPGTPTVFYDHLHDGGLVNAIKSLIQIRKQQGIHCKSSVEVLKADQSVYAAKIDKDTVMKIGYGDFHPGNGWQKTGSGKHWAVWTTA